MKVIHSHPHHRGRILIPIHIAASIWLVIIKLISDTVRAYYKKPNSFFPFFTVTFLPYVTAFWPPCITFLISPFLFSNVGGKSGKMALSQIPAKFNGFSVHSGRSLFSHVAGNMINAEKYIGFRWEMYTKPKWIKIWQMKCEFVDMCTLLLKIQDILITGRTLLNLSKSSY